MAGNAIGMNGTMGYVAALAADATVKAADVTIVGRGSAAGGPDVRT